MYRQSSSRNQRSNGVKVKYAIQISLLLAVSFWLIYQVKHSHDKKKEFDETEAKAKASPHMHNGKNSILGRKGVNTQDEETTSVIGDTLHKSIEEEENVEGDEENKQEEDENKPEEDEHEEKDIDHEQENLDAENEAREVDSVDSQTEGEKSLSDESGHSGNGNDNKSAHEARDENYKADDASSAVTHETHEARMGTDESVNERTENSSKHPEISVLDDDNKEVSKDLEVERGEIPNVDHQEENMMISEANVESLDSYENGSPPNGTLMIEKSSEIENHELSEPKPELDQDSNSTDSTETKETELQQYEGFSSSSDNNTVTLSSNSSVGSGNTTESSLETEDEVEEEKSGLNDGTDENSKSPVAENPEEEIRHEDGIDEFDASDSLEEKHVRTDLDTLPEIQTEGGNNDDDVAAE